MGSEAKDHNQHSAVVVLTAEEVESIWLRAGFEYSVPDSARLVADTTRERVERESSKSCGSLDTAIRFGAFSYLLESVRNSEASDAGSSAAVAVAMSFLRRNEEVCKYHAIGSALQLDSGTLARFAEIMIRGEYDWESFCIDFLDPEAAFVNRLRQNLGLSPSQRWRRHEELRRQMNRARRAG
jgi:hypothetical protein